MPKSGTAQAAGRRADVSRTRPIAQRRTGDRDQQSAACARSGAVPMTGSSCSSHARIPVSATASAMVAVDSFAASYFTCSRWPMTSAEKSSSPTRLLEPPLEQRDFLAAVHALDLEGRLGVQLAHGAGCGHARLALPAAAGARSCTCSRPCSNSATMCWSSSDVVDVAAVTARLDQPHAAQESQLMGHGRLGEAEQRGEIADAALRHGRARRGYAHAWYRREP